MGFSAGGHLVADVSTNYRKRAYAVMDEIDGVSCKPNFGVAMYPGHMTFHTTKPYELNNTLPVDSATSPMFILQAGNDPIDTIQNSLVCYIALKKAGVPAEYHIYAEGGHAFGLNKSAQKISDWEKLPVAGWEELVERWLQTIKMTSVGYAKNLTANIGFASGADGILSPNLHKALPPGTSDSPGYRRN